MIPTWQLKRQAEGYSDQLEQMLVQRIRFGQDETLVRAGRRDDEELSDLSREINEELDRIEAIVKECKVLDESI
jgi:hypothetical protein